MGQPLCTALIMMGFWREVLHQSYAELCTGRLRASLMYTSITSFLAYFGSMTTRFGCSKGSFTFVPSQIYTFLLVRRGTIMPWDACVEGKHGEGRGNRARGVTAAALDQKPKHPHMAPLGMPGTDDSPPGKTD